MPLHRKLTDFFKSKGDKSVIRIRRRRRIIALLWNGLPALITALLLSGYLWMLSIPAPTLGQRTYIDENALQPGQVRTYWDWADVHRADEHLFKIESLYHQNATSVEIAGYLTSEFEAMGLPAAMQRYSIATSTGVRNGTNSYAILSSPRTSGAEAMIISASLLSKTPEGTSTVNYRGISTVLSLAAFLKDYSMWAKDLIFVISDGYLEGMQAWISGYHGVTQTNIQAESLSLFSGVIWTALNIEYPGHSFSHLGVFYEGLNGRLPNQDLINSFERISRYTGGVPVVLYDNRESTESSSDQYGFLRLRVSNLLPASLWNREDIQEYGRRAKTLLRHVNYQARGKTNGIHGLMHRFRIDAITIYAVPAVGPHGFHTIGRVVESTLRTMNNLLERLHASFFFYLLVGPTTFMKIGSYLPCTILISVAMLFAGLREWINAGWLWSQEPPHNTNAREAKALHETGHWARRRRPILPTLCVMAATHAGGALLFRLLCTEQFFKNQTTWSPALFCALVTIPLGSLLLEEQPVAEFAPLSSVLRASNLCLTSAITSIISVANFSLAATLTALLGLVSCIPPMHLPLPARLTRYFLTVCLGFGWIFMNQQVREAVADWEMFTVWFLPFVCIVYTPLVLQVALVTLLCRRG